MTGKKQEGGKDPESETQLNLLRIVKEGFVVLGCILPNKSIVKHLLSKIFAFSS